MNKKLNTIALATSLAGLGFCSLTYGWQTTVDSLDGPGVANHNLVRHSADAMLPPIFTSAQATPQGGNLPPIVTGKLIKQVSAESPAIQPNSLDVYSGGAGLKPLEPLNSVMTPKAPHVYRPPAPLESVVQTPVDQPPVAHTAKAAAPLSPQPAQGSGSRSFQNNGSGSRSFPRNSALAPQGSGTRSSQGSGTRSSQGSGTRSSQGSGTRSNLDGAAALPSVVQQPVSSTYTAPAAANPNRPAANANPAAPNNATPAVGDGTSYFNQNAENFGAPAAHQHGSCATCGNGLVDGACSTCGPGAAYSDGPVIRDYGTFGSVSAASRYLYADALVYTRADGDIANSNFGTLNDFDFTGGLRITYGVRDDSIFGREISFLGLPDVEQEISRTDPLGRLSVNITPNGSTPDAFFNATNQTQRKESDLYALEFNRVNWGWDLIKTFSGIRVLKFDDSYSVASSVQTAAADASAPPVTTTAGNFSLDASNLLVGAHIGGELFYDIGYRWSVSGFSKFGLFASFSDFDTNLNNDGFNFSSESDNATVSSVIELGALAHYQLRTNLRFRAGYNALFIGNVASVSDNLSPSAGLFTGPEINDSDDVFFHGFNFGLEFYR